MGESDEDDVRPTDSLLQRSAPEYKMPKKDKDKEKTEVSERWHVVAFCALTACIASMVAGMSLSFSSIIINELNTSMSVRKQWRIEASGVEASLIGGFMPIGAMLGGFLAWPVADYLGRKLGLMIGGAIGLNGWLTIALSVLVSSRTPFLIMVYCGRILSGVSTGWSIYCVSIYISEISSAKYKGLFGNCNQLLVTVGILTSFVFGIEFGGKRVSFFIVALVAAGLAAVFEALMLFTSETPRWLFGKKKDVRGEKVLRRLRGPDADIGQEMDRIKSSLKKSYTVLEQLKEFRFRSVYQPFLLVLMLPFFQQFSGINAVMFYSSGIFMQAGFHGNMVEILAALATGVPSVVFTFVSVLLIDHLGRRVLLITSSVGMMFSSIILAVYFGIYYDVRHCDKKHLTPATEDYCSKIGYVAFAGVIIFISSFSIGWGPIPWTSLSELLPNKVRGLAGSIAAVSSWTYATIITLGFVHYVELVTPKYAWAVFGLIMLISIVCVFLFLPETKGHSVEEIQEYFEHGQIFAVKLNCSDDKQMSQKCNGKY